MSGLLNGKNILIMGIRNKWVLLGIAQAAGSGCKFNLLLIWVTEKESLQANLQHGKNRCVPM